MKWMAFAGLLLVAMTGCARHESGSPNASPAGINNKADCETAGGEWHAVTHRCDEK